jgi:hypothetical protein
MKSCALSGKRGFDCILQCMLMVKATYISQSLTLCIVMKCGFGCIKAWNQRKGKKSQLKFATVQPLPTIDSVSSSAAC